MSTTNGSSAPSSGALRQELLAPVLISCAGLIAGMALRWLLQSDAASVYCRGEPMSWWCDIRSGLGLLIHFRVFGWLALCGALASWWVGGRALALAALSVAVLGLALYNTDLAALGFVVAVLRSARP